MFRVIDIHTFYMECEDHILNQDIPAAIIFTKEGDELSENYKESLKEVVEDMGLKISVFAMDIDDAKEFANEYLLDDTDVPSLIIFEHGYVLESYNLKSHTELGMGNVMFQKALNTIQSLAKRYKMEV